MSEKWSRDRPNKWERELLNKLTVTSQIMSHSSELYFNLTFPQVLPPLFHSEVLAVPNSDHVT